jgi:acyl-CoA thioesterase-1
VGILAVVVATCASNGIDAPTSPGNAPAGTIVAFGDSLTAGFGLDPAQTYPALLQRRLDDAGYPYRMRNAGEDGDTTTTAAARLDRALTSDTMILIVALGINDGLRGVAISRIEDNLASIIERTRARGIEVLLCGMEAPPVRGFTYSVEFHRIYTRLAARYQLPLVPFILIGIAGHRDLNLPNGVHPNAKGHEIIATTIWTYLEPLLMPRVRV